MDVNLLLYVLLGLLNFTTRICCGTLFGVTTASVANVQGEPEKCSNMGICALLCDSEDTCTQAVYDDVTGTCTKSSMVGVFHGKYEPDDINIVSF